MVHRDVKGENLILSEKERRFKLIDFGVACDLVSRTNYDEDLNCFDPSYCPPEASGSGALGEGGLVVAAGGRFDVFSAGLLVVQMCFPQYRSDKGIARFKQSLRGSGWNLREWRQAVEGDRSFEDGFKVLDRNGGMALLEGCLREDPKRRITSAAAASSGFCRA